ncbi:hypothetical protein ACIRSU_35645 [Streptomyces sp. NPDC101160]|uniref:hypothetical protein n=1 Tax=Streptomyces sp. NPDC101160 TaxID=3366118 RepID=UPI0038117FE5
MSATARPRRAALATVLCAATLALGATACGPFPDLGSGSASGSGADKPKATGPFAELTGPEVADKAMTATKSAKSLSLDLDLKTSDGPMKAYVSTGRQGRCAGTMTIGATGTAEFVHPAGQAVYMRLDKAFLKEQTKGESPDVRRKVIRKLMGRWIKTGAKSPDAKGMLDLCDLKSLLSDFEGPYTGLKKGKETTVDGQKALPLTDSDGGEKIAIYVATEGTPYVLRIVTTGGKEPGTMTFSHYDEPVEAKAPPKKDVLDEKSLG